jgi:phosphoenolpyruvate carboxylase
MSKAANHAKTRWNANNYTQVKAHVNPQIAAEFKAACMASGVSMAEKLSQFMSEYSGMKAKGKTQKIYAKKRQRRAAIKLIISQLEDIKNAEENSLNNTPESFHGTEAYETAEHCVSQLEEAIELLTSIY